MIAACSGDSCRPSPPVFFRGLTTFDVITHGAHLAGPQPGVSGRKTPLLAQSRRNTAPGTVALWSADLLEDVLRWPSLRMCLFGLADPSAFDGVQ